ncbi:flagellar biosynthetic protein FliR [Mesobacterium sp. TK19101]|uniref:Flagellar biosynthetic protein FliR n=1 Tax=Mesobacterium hydrothermale TaxID=3111907 RepID=A0ABU6HG81_9RHOB|nr:flagellar biosynthetic protein FliR [Mesobacterium sp. TK19101]MEC3861361.1 flagellar biosynthetic protein FliR [Mesobacterium sp. TK19101]
MTLLDFVLEQASALGWSFVLVFLRVGAAVSVMPGFGERSIPMRYKLMLAAALTVAVGASNPALPPIQSGVAGLAWPIVSETAVGLLLGLMLRLFILAMQTAGSIAAQSTSLAQIAGGAFPEPLPAIGHILSLAALTLLMITGFHVKTVLFLTLSYDLFPAGSMPDPQIVGQWGTALVGRAFALAFQLAAPFLLLSLAYNLVLGAINRAMPQLMVAFVGAPVITWGSLAVLLLVAPMLLSVWAGQVDAFLANPVAGAR